MIYLIKRTPYPTMGVEGYMVTDEKEFTLVHSTPTKALFMWSKSRFEVSNVKIDNSKELLLSTTRPEGGNVTGKILAKGDSTSEIFNLLKRHSPELLV